MQRSSIFSRVLVTLVLFLALRAFADEPKQLRITIHCNHDDYVLKTLNQWPQVQEEMNLSAGFADFYFTWEPHYLIGTPTVNGEFLTLVAPSLENRRLSTVTKLKAATAFGAHRMGADYEYITISIPNLFETQIFIRSLSFPPAFALTSFHGEKYFSVCDVQKHFVF